MMSGSYANLLDLTSGNFPAIAGGGLGIGPRRRLSPVMIVAGTLTELVDRTNNVFSDVPFSIAQDRIIIVANQLPVRSKSRPGGHGWIFSWDEDSLRRHHRCVSQGQREGTGVVLTSWLVSSVVVVSIVSMGGIGKATFARMALPRN